MRPLLLAGAGTGVYGIATGEIAEIVAAAALLGAAVLLAAVTHVAHERRREQADRIVCG